MFKHAQTIWNSFDSSRTLAQNYCEPMAFRKPHLKEKLQAWNLTEAKAKAFKMFNAMIAPCAFFRGCIYLHILTENRFIFIQNSKYFILSCKFIGFHFSQYSPMKSHQPDGVRMDVLGCRTFWNFTKRNGTGLRKKWKKGHQKDKDKDFLPA